MRCWETWGASFGRHGKPFGRSKGSVEGLRETKVLSRKVRPTGWDFVHAQRRPFFLPLSIPPTYRFPYTDGELWLSHIPIALTLAGSANRLGPVSPPKQISGLLSAPPASPPT